MLVVKVFTALASFIQYLSHLVACLAIKPILSCFLVVRNNLRQYVKLKCVTDIQCYNDITSVHYQWTNNKNGSCLMFIIYALTFLSRSMFGAVSQLLNVNKYYFCL